MDRGLGIRRRIGHRQVGPKIIGASETLWSALQMIMQVVVLTTLL